MRKDGVMRSNYIGGSWRPSASELAIDVLNTVVAGVPCTATLG
jgi:hypothetical protein